MIFGNIVNQLVLSLCKPKFAHIIFRVLRWYLCVSVLRSLRGTKWLETLVKIFGGFVIGSSSCWHLWTGVRNSKLTHILIILRRNYRISILAALHEGKLLGLNSWLCVHWWMMSIHSGRNSSRSHLRYLSGHFRIDGQSRHESCSMVLFEPISKNLIHFKEYYLI